MAAANRLATDDAYTLMMLPKRLISTACQGQGSEAGGSATWHTSLAELYSESETPQQHSDTERSNTMHASPVTVQLVRAAASHVHMLALTDAGHADHKCRPCCSP